MLAVSYKDRSESVHIFIGLFQDSLQLANAYPGGLFDVPLMWGIPTIWDLMLRRAILKSMFLAWPYYPRTDAEKVNASNSNNQ